jgi:uncharacterized protein (TIRG00374 family)
MPPPFRRWVEVTLTTAGASLLLYLVSRIGLRVLWDNIVAFGPWFLVTCGVACAWLWLQSLSWWLVQKRVWPQARFLPLWRAKMIGDGFNFVLPSGGVGGDAMRPYLTRAHVPLEQGIAAVVFDKTLEFVGSVVFIAPVLSIGLLTIDLPAGAAAASAVSLAISTVLIALLVAGLRLGLTNVLLTVARFVPGLRRRVLRRHERLRALDDSLARLRTAGVRASLWPLALHVLARVAGGIEVLVVMAVLGAPVTFIQAMFVSAIVTIGNTVFFLLPGQWGVAESVHVVVVRSLGCPASIGLSLALLRRIRRLLMVGVSLVLYATGGRAPEEAAHEP